jgi:hypothetical protein
MAFLEATLDESKLPMLPLHDVADHSHDLGDHESDTTEVASIKSLEKSRIPFVRRVPTSWDVPDPSEKHKDSFWTWLRWGIVVGLQIIIALLLWRPTGLVEREFQSVLKGKHVETGGDINGLYQTRTPSFSSVMSPQAALLLIRVFFLPRCRIT